MHSRRAIALVALAALLPLASTTVAGGKAKPKPVKCKAGQIKVKAGKKKARCRPIKVALPRPRTIDPRVAFIQSALNMPVPKAKGKKARSGKRRAKPLRRGFGRAGKRAYNKLLKALPKALAKVDAKAPGRAPTAGIATAQAAQANPCGENGDVLGSSTTSDRGVIITSSVTRGGLGMTIVFSTGGYAFVIEYSTTVGCDSLNVPACPTASGAAEAQSSKLDRVRVDVRKDGRLVSSQRTSVRRQTKTHGQTAGDAKLDFVDVDDVVAMSTTAGGVSLNGTLTRHTHISMRTEQYDPSQSTASFVGAEALQRTDNGSFAGLARSTIGVYRSAESAPDTLGLGGGWSVFDQRNSGSYCINLKFNPERRTIKVKKGKSGTFTGQAIAKSDGGVATESRWERTAQYNGTFSPERTSGNSVTINYTVTAAPPGELVVSEYKVTSTAGVVQGSWAQDTEPTTINHIAGSFNGTQTLVGGTAGNAVMAFTGTMVYDRFGASPFGGADGRFQFASGEYTLVASGLDQSGVTLCRQTGSKRFDPAELRLHAGRRHRTQP